MYLEQRLGEVKQIRSMTAVVAMTQASKCQVGKQQGGTYRSANTRQVEDDDAPKPLTVLLVVLQDPGSQGRSLAKDPAGNALRHRIITHGEEEPKSHIPIWRYYPYARHVQTSI